MSELEKKSNSQDQAMYTFALVFFVGVIIFASAVWFSFDKLNQALEQKNVLLEKKIIDLEKQLDFAKNNTEIAVPSEDTKNSVNLNKTQDSDTPKVEDNKYLGSEGAKVVLVSDDIDLSKSPFRGSNDSNFVMIEFSDFQCPYCTRAYPTVKKIIENYGDKLKFVYAHLPLSFHPYAQKAAEASECAADQGKFWEYHDILFETNKLQISDLKEDAKTLGLNTVEFDKCLDSGIKSAIIAGNVKLAQKNGATGTPTFFLNGKKIVGAQPYENFAAEIDAMLAGKPLEEKPTPPPTPKKNTTVKKKPTAILAEVSNRSIKGPEDALFTIIEFSDYQCPYCKSVQPTLEKLLYEYDGKVNLVHMNFIVHPGSHLASEAVECAGDQGKYFKMHDLIYDTSKTDEAGLKELATQIGLDINKFNVCLDSGAKSKTVDDQTAIGRSVGVRGTPSFIIGPNSNGQVLGEFIVGAQPIETFRKTLDNLVSNLDDGPLEGPNPAPDPAAYD